jgi:hypothetical protein
MQKELKKTGSSEEVVGTGAMNKSVYHPPSSSSGGPQGVRKQGNKGNGFFLTETAENNIDELIQQAPFTFKFIPTKNILQKMIVRATQIKTAKELEPII